MRGPTDEEIAAAVAVLLRAFRVATISRDDRAPLVLVTPAGGLHVEASAEAAEGCVRRELPALRRRAEAERRAAMRARLRLVRGGA